MAGAQLTEQLGTRVADAVRSTGLELEALEVSSAGRRQLVRVVVDTPDGAALDLDAVADVSREVSAVLDGDGTADAAFGSAYTLEVSSPGLDRPLTLPRHWVRARLRLVRVTTADGEVLARAGDCDDTGVTLLIDGTPRRVLFAEIDRAVVEVEFAEPPAAELAALGAAKHREGEGSP